ncbi:hypothetical protein ACFWGM_36320, partial [Streptomyces roseolus]
MAANGITYTGLDALLTPEKSVLLLIDHQGAQFAGMGSADTNLVARGPGRHPQHLVETEQVGLLMGRT